MTETVKAPDRLKVLERIKEYEKNKTFDKDVEDDLPFESLQPQQVDFLNKKISSKIKTFIANFLGRKFYLKMLKQKDVIMSDVQGLENLKGFKGGAIITCNHLHIFDNAAVCLGLEKHFKRINLYKLIKEGNYAIPGKIGFFMRNANTLPISQNSKTLINCINAVKTLLQRDKLILIYPEQAMWWNYKKPRPLKTGAFKFSAKFNVPVIPCFLTLKDTNLIGKDGFPVQEFTLHVLPLIYPDNSIPINESCENMKNLNFNLWKDKYEEIYNEKLDI